MKKYNEINRIVNRIELDTIMGILHGILLPVLAMFLFQSRLGLVYLLIPFTVYNTVGSHRGSKEIFYASAMIVVSISIASWADA